MTNPTPHGQVPEALRLAALLDADEWPGSMSLVGYARACAAELLRLHAENQVLRTTHVQNPAENEHVAGDVSKNGVKLNVSTQQTAAGATPECLTCSDHGAVGNILTAEPCPDCTRLNAQPAPATQQAGATKEHVRLVRVIADKIEDGTLFQSGIYSNKDLARFVRNVADAAAPQPSSTPQATDSVTAPAGGVVAYLDIGAGGYLDLGSDLSNEAISRLPKGRHTLIIAGTYGIDGYTAASTPQSAPPPQPAPAGVLEDAARWHWMAEYIVGTRTDLDDELIASATVDELRKLVDADLAARSPTDGVPAPVQSGLVATMLDALRHAQKVLNHNNLHLECGPVNAAILAARAPADSAEPVRTWCDGCSPEKCGGCHIPNNAAAPAQAISQPGGFDAGDMASAAAQGYRDGWAAAQAISAEPTPDELRAIAREARNSSGSASDDCGSAMYVLYGWRAAISKAAHNMNSAEPIAVTTGYYGGQATVKALDGTLVLPVGIALYTHPALEKPEIRCPVRLANGGDCPRHNLQCGWPDCNKETK